MDIVFFIVTTACDWGHLEIAVQMELVVENMTGVTLWPEIYFH